MHGRRIVKIKCVIRPETTNGAEHP